MGKNRLGKDLRVINDVQDRVYRHDSRVICGESSCLFRDAIKKQGAKRGRRFSDYAFLSIAVSCGGLLLWGVISVVCSWRALFFTGFWVILVLELVAFVIFSSMSMRCVSHGWVDAVDEWYSGAYRESSWYQGLDADGRAHVIGIIESKPYRVLSERVRSMESLVKYDMGPTVSMLDREILNNMAILESGMVDAYTSNKLRGMTRVYEAYRSRLCVDDRLEPLQPITKGMTDLMQDDEELLAKAVDEYNDEVRLVKKNHPMLRKYKSMMKQYRESLVRHPEYHHGNPMVQVLMDAECLAYAGFTE